jgi:S-adenosylmethionine-diacylglycerol 3-amino-3-carboxypropyl transferase
VKRNPTLADQVDQHIFNAIYSRSLVYNTCWEDPAVDRQALDFRPDDTVLVITSAGCNALDYALNGVKRIHTVDANPRQTALLELKLAGIRRLEHGDFFQMFGRGYHPHFRELYHDSLRGELEGFSREYWDNNLAWFSSRAGSFYYHGLSGIVARGFRAYLKLRPQLAEPIGALFETRSLEQQRALYDERIRPLMWSRGMNWALSRQLTMSLLGVPHPQRKEVQAQHAGGVAGFIRESIEYVFRQLPAWNNYFWRVYVLGRYSPECCPEYLKPANFQALKHGLADCVVPHTDTVTDFLRRGGEPISKFVLLDHMDWMGAYHPQALLDEWAALLGRATPGARVIFRSAHARPSYLDWIELETQSARRRLRDVLYFHDALAARLSRLDRVHTYAGFHIADLPA